MTARRLSQQNPTLYDLGRPLTPFERWFWGRLLLVVFWFGSLSPLGWAGASVILGSYLLTLGAAIRACGQ